MGIFKERLKGKFKQVFKRQPGGTPLGNLIRKGLNVASGGVLGNGAFKLQEGETPQDAQSRENRFVGEVVEQVDASTKTALANKEKAIRKEAMIARIKKYAGWIVGGVFVLIGGVWYVVKRKK